MPNAVVDKLTRFFSTGAGTRFLEEAEREAAEKEAQVQGRRDLAAQRAEFLRRRREVVPALHRTAEAAERDLAEARKAMRAECRRVVDARHAESGEQWAIREGLRRVEGSLACSADPRLLRTLDEVAEALRNWHHTSGKLHRFVSRKASNWDGTEEYVKFYGDNSAGVDAMKARVEAAEKALNALLLVAEPEDAAVEAAVTEARAAIEATAGDPPAIQMQEYDYKGKPVGGPVTTTVAK